MMAADSWGVLYKDEMAFQYFQFSVAVQLRSVLDVIYKKKYNQCLDK